MSRVCELTGKGRQVGNNVSHANNKTKRTFLPNLQNVTLISDTLGQSVKLRVSTHGLRSVEHVGGLDNWLAKTGEEKLSLKARKLKRALAKQAKEAAAQDRLERFVGPRAAAQARFASAPGSNLKRKLVSDNIGVEDKLLRLLRLIFADALTEA